MYPGLLTGVIMQLPSLHSRVPGQLKIGIGEVGAQYQPVQGGKSIVAPNSSRENAVIVKVQIIWFATVQLGFAKLVEAEDMMHGGKRALTTNDYMDRMERKKINQINFLQF